jgi:enoyl-CoA hydratase
MEQAVTMTEPTTGVRLIHLNRPQALNAMNAELIEGLHRTVSDIEGDPDVRAIVVTGSGRAFCAGLDLRGYGEPPGATGREGRVQSRLRVQQHLADLGERFRRTRAPIIAAVNGVASGGGLALSLLCDVRVVSESARFLPSFVQRGLSGGDLGTTWLLPRIVGFTRAFEILVTARPIDADEAVRIGLAVAMHPDEELLAAALEMASVIASNSPFGTWMTKELMWSNLETGSFRAAVDLENRTQILGSLTGDYKEAVLAFRDRRPANFTNS